LDEVDRELPELSLRPPPRPSSASSRPHCVRDQAVVDEMRSGLRAGAGAVTNKKRTRPLARSASGWRSLGGVHERKSDAV